MKFSPDNAVRQNGLNGDSDHSVDSVKSPLPAIFKTLGIPSINGTFEEVATFFRVTVWTVNQWKKEKAIGHWQHGRNVMFGEESVLDFYVAKYSAARGLAPGEAREIGRKEWREHLGVHRAEEQRKLFEAIDRRCEAVEKRLAALERAA